MLRKVIELFGKSEITLELIGGFWSVLTVVGEEFHFVFNILFLCDVTK
jgi:hypothetical protein